jgi:hypothetical protein
MSAIKASKSTCELPTTVTGHAAPLATSEETRERYVDDSASMPPAGHSMTTFGTPHWRGPTHDDIMAARQSLRKSLSATTLPSSSSVSSSKTYENIAEEPNYQNVSLLKDRFSLELNPDAAEVLQRARLDILDEADEAASFERLDMLRASKKLFASQRDLQQRQNSLARRSLLNLTGSPMGQGTQGLEADLDVA